MLRRFFRPLLRRLPSPGLFMNPFRSRTHGRRRRFSGRHSAGFAHEALETRSLLSGVPVSVAASGPLSFSQDVVVPSVCTIQLDASAVTAPQIGQSAAAGSVYQVVASSGLSAGALAELTAGIDRAAGVMSSLVASSDFESVMQGVFGRAGTDSASFSAGVAALKADLAAGRLGVQVQAVPAADMGQAMGAYAASYAGGERIFINADWLASTPGAEQVARVLLEEFGHSVDQRLNAGVDSPGDEGEVFAFSLQPEASLGAAAQQDDHAVLRVGGGSLTVEMSATDTDGDGVVDSSDLDDDNDGIADNVEAAQANKTPLSSATVAFTYAQSAGVDGVVAGYPSFHDAASVLGTGDRNDPVNFYDGNLYTELRVHKGDIFEFRFGGTVASPRVIKAGSSFTLTEGSGSNDKNVDVYGSYGTTDAAGSANNATGGGMGWKNLQTMISSGTAVLLYSGPSDATKTFSTSIDITHFQVVGRGTHGGWADFSLDTEVDLTLDTDGDGVPNIRDLDSDNDGISDLRESVRGNPAAAVVVADANNDGTITATEASNYTATATNLLVSSADTNSNGVWNFLESGGTIGTTPVNIDGDGRPDFLDLDSDADGIPDTVEARATTSYTANDGDVRNDDADGDGVIGLFDTVVGFGGSFGTPVNTDNTGETSAPRSGTATNIVVQSGLKYSGGSNVAVLTVKDGDTTHVKVKEAGDRLVVDLGETLPAGSVITVQAKRNTNNSTYNDTVGLVLSQSNATGTVLSNKQTTTFADTNYKDITYTLTSATRYIDIDNNPPAADPKMEFRVSYLGWSYPESSVFIAPDYADTDSDDDGVLDKNESGLTRTGADANADGIDDGISASYQDPDGAVNPPLSTLLNVDGATAEVDYRSVNTNPLRISSIGVNEGSKYGVFTLSGRTTDTPVKLSLTTDNDPDTVNATVGTDTGTTIQYYDNKNGWTNYTTGNTVTLKANSTLLARVAITNDPTYEGPEAFRLKGTYGGTNSDASEGTGGIGTIYDDGSGDYWDTNNNTATPALPSGVTLDDDRPIEINDIVVNEGSTYGVYEVTAPLGASINLSLTKTGDGAGHATLGTDTATGAKSFQYSVDDGATWTDYTWNGTTGNRPTMPDGALEVRFKITNDNVLEIAETLKLTATRVSDTTTITSTGGNGAIRDDGLGDYWIGDSIAPASEAELIAANVTLDDDTPIEVFDVTVNEATGWAVFALEGQPGQAFTPSLATTGSGIGHAATTSDYLTAFEYYDPTANSNAGGWVAYASGTIALDSAGHGYVRVAIVNDSPAVFEGAETLRLNVTTISSVTSFGTVTILDDGNGLIFGNGTTADETVTKDNDKPTVSIAASPAGISEGDASETAVVTYTVTLSRTSPWDTVVTIDLTGTATLTTDYTVGGLTATGTPGRYTLTIPAGSTSGTFTMDPVGDTTYEGPETVIATIASAATNTTVALTVSTSSATATIYDDGSSKPGGGFYDSDIAPVAVANSYTTSEDTLLSGKNLITDDDNGATAGGVDSDTVGAALTIHSVVVGSTETPLADLPNGTGSRTGWKVLALANGTAYLKQDGSFEYAPAANSNAGDSFSYTVSNGEKASNAAAVTLDVTPVNDPPTSADGTIHAHQGEPYCFTDSDFAFSDVDNHNRGAVIITTLPAAGQLQWKNGSGTWVAVTASQAISYDDVMACKLRFVPADGAQPNADYTRFTFKVQDDSATTNTSLVANEITVELLDSRGPRNIVPIEQNIDEDSTLVFTGAKAISVAFIGEDGVDNDVETITTTLSVTAGTLTLGSTPAGATISGNGTGFISITGLRSKVNAALDGLTFTPVANANSLLPGGAHTYTTLTIETTNVPAVGGFQFATDTDSVDIGVRPINDAPVATGSATLAAIDEDTTNPPGATVASLFGANFGDSADEVTGGSAANTLAGIAIVGYTADADAGGWQYSSDGTTWTTLSNVTGNASAFTLKATDSLRFVPAQDFDGTPPSLTCRLIDSSTTVTTAATVNVSTNGGTSAVSAATVVLGTTVDPVNDPPVPTFDADQTATEDGSTLTGQLTSTDVDNTPGTEAYELDGDDIPGLTINPDGSFSFDPKDPAYQYLAVGETLEIIVPYKVTDVHGASGTGSFKITVTGIDDPQTLISLDNSEIAENNPQGATIGNLQTADADDADTFTYTLVSGTGDTDNDLFEIVDGALKLKSTTPSFDFETKTSYTVRVRSTVDGAGRTFTTREEALTITVLNVLEKLVVALATDSVRPDLSTNLPDKISNVGSVTLSPTGNETITGTNTVSDSRIEYSTDGTTWKTAFSPVQGVNTLRVRQVDPAGVLAPSEVTTFVYTFDTIVSSPMVTLQSDTGQSSSDKVTKIGLLSVRSETDSLVEYSVNNGATWTTSFTAVVGLNSLRVRQSDVAGNQSASTLFVFTYDISAAAPTVSLVQDTGTPGDNITRNAAIGVTGTETGAKVEYSADGGTTWASSFTPAQGPNTVRVRQTDVAGNESPFATVSFSYDTVASTPVIQLVEDTGASSTDRITNKGQIAIANAEPGALVEYSTNGGANWTSAGNAATAGSFTVNTWTTAGTYSLRVRQTDGAGNVSPAAAYSFTLDKTAAALRLMLTNDAGTSTTDRITNDGRLTLTGLESGAAVQYSLNGTSGWSSTFTPVVGVNTVYARQVDRSGNTSPSSTGLTFTLETTAPAMPTVALASDTGFSSTDKITSVGTLAIGGLETGGRAQYQRAGTTTWSTTFTPVQGSNSVKVRQMDVAGNVSPEVTFAFTLDSVAAAIQSVTSSASTAVVGDTLRISVKYGKSVLLGGTGTPALALTFGSVVRQAVYESGDGTDTLVFRYTIVAGDSAPTGVKIGSAINLGGRTLRDTAGNNALLTLPTTGLPSIIV
jgi:hypothetical protein